MNTGMAGQAKANGNHVPEIKTISHVYFRNGAEKVLSILLKS